jgi:hypothetical protein
MTTIFQKQLTAKSHQLTWIHVFIECFVELIQVYGCESNILKVEVNEMVSNKFEEEKQDKKACVQQSNQYTTLKSIIMVRL